MFCGDILRGLKVLMSVSVGNVAILRTLSGMPGIK
jgi:hypothetical protein